MAAVCAKCTVIGVEENGDLSVQQGLQGPPWLPDVAEYCTSERGMEHGETGRLPGGAEAVIWKCEM